MPIGQRYQSGGGASANTVPNERSLYVTYRFEEFFVNMKGEVYKEALLFAVSDTKREKRESPAA